MLPVDGVAEEGAASSQKSGRLHCAAVAVGVILHQFDEGALMQVEPVVVSVAMCRGLMSERAKPATDEQPRGECLAGALLRRSI